MVQDAAAGDGSSAELGRGIAGLDQGQTVQRHRFGHKTTAPVGVKAVQGGAIALQQQPQVPRGGFQKICSTPQGLAHAFPPAVWGQPAPAARPGVAPALPGNFPDAGRGLPKLPSTD